MSFRTVYVRQGLLLVLGIAVLIAASVLVLRAFEGPIARVGTHIGRGIESSLRESIKAELAIDPHYHEIHNPTVDAALSTIRDRLVSSMNPASPWPIEIVVVRNNELNAFTLPGGIIVVYSGLIRRADSAEELAAVLSHELGHVAHGDIMKTLGRNLAIGAILSAGGVASPTVINQIVQNLGENAFSRQAEDQADRYGLSLLAAGGIRPAHLAAIFKKLDPEDDTKASAELFKWMGSHPETASRITIAQEADRNFKGPERPLGIDWKAVVTALP